MNAASQRRAASGLVWAAIAVLLIAWLMPLAGLLAAMAVALARWWRWPTVGVKHYFTSRKAALPAAAALVGAGFGFLPEILARLDAVFPFARLSSRDVARVVERFLLQFAHDAGITLESCDSALPLDLVTHANKTRD